MIVNGARVTLTVQERGRISTIDVPVAHAFLVERPEPRLIGEVRNLEITLTAPQLTVRTVDTIDDPTPLYDRLMEER